MTIRRYFGAMWAVVKRDAQLTFSYRFTFFTGWLGLFFSLTLFYYVSRLVKVAQFKTHDQYYAFAVVGLVILQVLNSTLQTPPNVLRQELVAGTFERIVSPFGPVGALTAMMVFPLLSAIFNAVVMLAFAGVVFGMPVRWSTAGLAVPLGILGALAFAPFGLLFMATVMVAKQVAVGTTWIVAGISLIAGLYFPVNLLPAWAQWLTHVQPFTPSVELLRNALVGTPLRDSAWVDLVKVVGFTMVLLPLSMGALRIGIEISRRRGTIVEY